MTRRLVSAPAIISGGLTSALSGSLAGSMLGGALTPPTGFIFLVDRDGAYLVDSDGAYLVEKI